MFRLLILTLLLAVASTIPFGRENLRRIQLPYRRQLAQSEVFKVPLFLELQFINEATASDIETKDTGNGVVAHFCKSVEQQVG